MYMLCKITRVSATCLPQQVYEYIYDRAYSRDRSYSAACAEYACMCARERSFVAVLVSVCVCAAPVAVCVHQGIYGNCLKRLEGFATGERRTDTSVHF